MSYTFGMKLIKDYVYFCWVYLKDNAKKTGSTNLFICKKVTKWDFYDIFTKTKLIIEDGTYIKHSFFEIKIEIV